MSFVKITDSPVRIGAHHQRFILLGLAAALAASSLLTLYGIWFYNKTNQLSREYMVQSSKTMAEALAAAVTADFITRNYGDIESHLQLVMANTQVVSALAVDDSGRLLAHLKRSAGANLAAPSYDRPDVSLPERPIQSTLDGDHIGTWVTVGTPVKLGWIYLETNAQTNNALLANLHRQTLLIFALSALGFMAFLGFCIFLTFNKVHAAEQVMAQHTQALTVVALHDPLTGLPNRHLLMDRLSQALASHNRTQDLLAICFIDLDGFKLVNDRFGHEAGDLLLTQISKRLLGCVREHDTVARIGGDEFLLLLNELEHPEQLLEILNRLLGKVGEPVDYQNQKLIVGASIGYTLYPEDSATPEQLIDHADSAMYNAKRAGKNRIARYNCKSNGAQSTIEG